MSIAVRAVGARAKAAGGGNITPGLPAGWAANDIHLCFVVRQAITNDPTMPAGWTLIAESVGEGSGAGGDIGTQVFWRRAVAGDTDPLVTYAGAAPIIAGIIGYSGCSTIVDPFEGAPTAATVGTDAGASASAAALTTVQANTLVVLFLGGSDEGTVGTYTGSPTPTERVDDTIAGSGSTLAIADFAMATPGTTGARAATLSAAGARTGFMLALRGGISCTFQKRYVGETPCFRVFFPAADAGELPTDQDVIDAIQLPVISVPFLLDGVTVGASDPPQPGAPMLKLDPFNAVSEATAITYGGQVIDARLDYSGVSLSDMADFCVAQLEAEWVAARARVATHAEATAELAGY